MRSWRPGRARSGRSAGCSCTPHTAWRTWTRPGSTPSWWSAAGASTGRAGTARWCPGSPPRRPGPGGSPRCAAGCSCWRPRGLLDGRRVTTHWARGQQLAREHPGVRVDCDPIFVRDGRVWTSAGVTAGMDLALALVEDDLGRDVAHTVARRLVLFLRRPGGQSQFSPALWSRQPATDPVRAAVTAIHADPGARHDIAGLAAHAGLSPRHLQRRFTAELGVPPAAYVERVRVEAAQRALTEGDEPVEAIARRCGFATAETLRRTFHRRLGVAPSEYRARFRSTAELPDAAPPPAAHHAGAAPPTEEGNTA
ncbi:AraC-family transcriptional regulator [Streptomyces viridochromogenes DSM 40736]|uniref:AraC-family transcriptional regulator n=1 Tax=Streptomyces viridochromogenes (strain DSM 40736 / JCM 4977 / BCRC 1201 / Tue 494) TaxID=591159 RepID=D9XA94_STRVT|nr:AraC-family transcriptional regulator [Streptomyces viridochromogenes DSM 40736]